MPTPIVLDLSSHNRVESFEKIAASGIKGVILKATQSTRFTDSVFKDRVAAARKAGLLVGAYHFASGADVGDQVDHFLEAVGDTGDILLALDYEPNPNGSTMSLEQTKQWLTLVAERTGQRPVIYSGHLIKDTISKKGDAFLNGHRLWLAQYSAKAVLPPGWGKYWLWQYSDKARCPGIKNDNTVDVNCFGGDDLASEWIDRIEAPVALVADEKLVIPAADGEKPGLTARIGAALDVSDKNYSILNRLSEQGSRVAGALKAGKSWFYRLIFGGVGGGTAASQLVDTSKETGPVRLFMGWVEAHPFLFAGICLTLIAAAVYFCVLKRSEKFLVTAFKDGRYSPRGSQ